MSSDTIAGEETERPALARELGLTQILLFGIGGIVGAGIYAIIGEAAAFGGNLLWVSFLVAALVALCTAGTYAELVSRHPDAGGSFEYVKQAFGLRAATVASVFMLFTGVVAAGAIAISFSDYVSRLVDVPTLFVTFGVIATMGAVNAVGAAQASWFNTVATIVTLLGLAAVVVVAVDDLGSVDPFDASGTDLIGILTGGALIFFSFIGFEDLVKLAEETRDPERTMPKGLLLSGVAVMVIYLLVAFAALATLGADGLAGAQGPLAEILRDQAGGAWATGIVVVALFAISKTILSNILGASRLLYDVGRDVDQPWLGHLTKINRATSTPVRAVVAVSVVAAAFGAIGNLGVVAAASNIFIMLVFLVVNAALLRIRQRSEAEPAFRIPVNVGCYPLTTLIAVIGVLVLLGFNVSALVRGVA